MSENQALKKYLQDLSRIKIVAKVSKIVLKTIYLLSSIYLVIESLSKAFELVEIKLRITMGLKMI